MKRKDSKINDNVKKNWLYYKCEIKKCFNDLKHRNTFYRQIPNLLTISRVIGMIPVSILFLTGNNLIGMLLLGMILSTDFFDGKIARKYGIVSKLGADLDAVCDKLMAVFLMIPLLNESYILLFNMFLEALISFVNVNGRVNGIDTKTVFTGKIKTCILSLTLLVGYLTKFINISHSLLILFSTFTALVQLKTYYDYNKFIASRKIINEKKKNDKEIFCEDNKKVEDKIDELKREREALLSSTEICEKEKIKVRKRKK